MNEWFAGLTDTFTRCFINENRYELLISGVGVTIKVSLLAVILGILIGFLIALCNLSKKKALNFIGTIYTDIIRGTPSVTQLMIIYFVIFASINLDKWIIVSNEYDTNGFFYIGTIIKAGKNKLTIKPFDADGIWLEEMKIPYEDITSVSFDTRYINNWRMYLERTKEG